MRQPKFKVGDKVRILDGSKIKNYAGQWVSMMRQDIGKVATIREVHNLSADNRVYYKLQGCPWLFDERGLEPAGETPTFKKFKNNTIVIYRDGQNVIALDKATGLKAIAKCSPEDKFIFEIGARLSLDRLFSLLKMDEAKDSNRKKKFKVGDIVIGNEDAGEMYCITGKDYIGIVTKILSEDEIEINGKFRVEKRCFDRLIKDGN